MKNLLITTIGKYNHLQEWISGQRHFDIALINYDNHRMSMSMLDAVYYDTKETFKWQGIWDMLWDDPTLLQYDYYWMPDEDILLETDKINELFEKMSMWDLDLAQPSIEKSDISFPSWELFIHKEGANFIATNFVEIMCPCFSRLALQKVLPTFRESKSGWGLDLVWPKIIGDTGLNIGIINSIVAKHTRKPTQGSNLYEKIGVSPRKERLALMKKYGVSNIDIKVHSEL